MHARDFGWWIVKGVAIGLGLLVVKVAVAALSGGRMDIF